MTDIANLGKLFSVSELKAQVALARYRDAKVECELVLQEISRLKSCNMEAGIPSDQAVLDLWQRWREGKLKELARRFTQLRKIAERKKMDAAAMEGRRIVVRKLLESAVTQKHQAQIRKNEVQTILK